MYGNLLEEDELISYESSIQKKNGPKTNKEHYEVSNHNKNMVSMNNYVKLKKISVVM
jgi:hypothetical protein